MKREDAIKWDEYFMGIAVLSSHRSKDPSTQVGACIVDSQNKIVGVGYNGFPWGCSDDDLPWVSEGEYLETKNPYVCHAELNAVLNSIKDLIYCKIYTTLFPCNECAKVIIQAGIAEIIYLADKGKSRDSAIAAKLMFDMSGVTYRRFETKLPSITLSFLTDHY